MNNRIQIALDRLDRAVKEHNPVAVFGLFSGGHDSLSATKIASMHPKFTAAVHINTGIGIARTREFVRDTCKKQGWRLLEYKATENTNGKGMPDPQVYEEIVLRSGFPGPASHRIMYWRLKERCLRMLQRDCLCSVRLGRRILYVSGARSGESTRRMGYVQEVKIDEQRIWVSPIHDWSKLDTTKLMEHFAIPRNPVVDLIHKSGECLCGAFAKTGELEELSLWPETKPAYNRIKALEIRVKEAGFAWGWEGRPSRQRKAKVYHSDMPLCHSCEAR